MNKDYIYKYYSRTELGQRMLKSGSFSEEELLFMIPNNEKKLHGLPMTRILGKHKFATKKKKLRYILNFKVLDIINELVNEKFPIAIDIKSIEV